MRLINRSKDINLNKKISIFYCICIALCGVLTSMAMHFTLLIYDNKLYENAVKELDFFIQKVNKDLERIEIISGEIAFNTTIQEQLYLLNTLSPKSIEYNYELLLYKHMLLDEITAYEYVDNITYIKGDDVKFTLGTVAGISEEKYRIIESDFNRAKGGYIKYMPNTINSSIISGRNVLYKIDASLDYLGSIILFSDINIILDSLIKDLDNNSVALWVLNNDEIIYISDFAEKMPLLNINKDKGYDIFEYKGEKYFTCFLTSKENNLKFINMSKYSELYGQMTNIKKYVFFGYGIIFLVSIIILSKIVSKTLVPLECLVESMEIVEDGNFAKAIDRLDKVDRKDEIGVLNEKFRKMLERIENLIDENYKKELIVINTKYKMLQAQINPHFLYNTLNAIQWAIRRGEGEKAEGMIISLSQVLRASLTKKDFVTIEDELELVKSYIDIQKHRYKDRIEFIFKVNGNLGYYIPNMTIQPLVENCIQHVVDKTIKKCKVIIMVKELENSVEIKVIDNGSGLMEKEVQNILNFTAKPKGHGIGLKNIRERLNVLDKNSTFNIKSSIGVGTEVCICISRIDNVE
ncbi:MAG: sensor histidine kinase [Lachnospirales bacterium]